MKRKHPLSYEEGVRQMKLAKKRGLILGRALDELQRACEHIESLVEDFLPNDKLLKEFYQMWLSEARTFIAYGRKEGK